MDVSGVDERSNETSLNADKNNGARTINLQKCENGYGFTLRYFVVYPPEKPVYAIANSQEEDGIASNESYPKMEKLVPNVSEAMDTIFVKNVKEGSEADKAGLATGDRIVSVNGCPITGMSYNQVLNLIQNCEGNLQLLVVPKEDDILQLYFSGSAYDQSSPSRNVTSDANDKSQVTPVSRLTYHHPTYARSRMASSCSLEPSAKVDTNINFQNSEAISNSNFSSTASSSSLPSYGRLALHQPCPVPYGFHSKKVPSDRYPFTYQSNIGNATSEIKSEPSKSNEDLNPMSTSAYLPGDIAYQHQLLVNRRKEEFLGQVGNGYESNISQLSWKSVPSKSASQSQSSLDTRTPTGDDDSPDVASSGINQGKLPWNSESTMMQSWPAPHSDQTLLGNASKELNTIRANISNSQQSLHSNDDFDNRTSSFFAFNNSHKNNTNENILDAKSYSLVTQSDDVGSKLSRPFASTLGKIQENVANSTQKTNSSNSQLEKISSTNSPIQVSLRKACSLDSEGPNSKLTSQEIPASIDDETFTQLQLVSQRAKQFESGGQLWDDETNNKRNFYKNELARISSQYKTPKVLERTAKYESMSAASSQETICTIPENDGTTSPPYRTSSEIEAKFSNHLAKMGIMTPSVVEATGSSDHKGPATITNTPLTTHTSKKLESRLKSRANQLKKSRAMRQNSYLTAVSQGVPSSPSSSYSSSSTSSPSRVSSSTGVVLRKKAFYESSNDDDRSGVRRVSYLKATSEDSTIDESKAVNKRAGHIDVSTEDNKTTTTPRPHIHSIQKLKSFFGERTPQIVEASEKAQQQLPSPTREHPSSLSQEITREGLLHCKATLVDGKRASDRSWKPVWAVLRGHVLYFYRDKKDVNHSPIGVADEHAPINVKSCIVDIAYDYTKKKNVFRLTTFGASGFLLQADDNSDMLHWIQAIQENSNPDNDKKGIGSQNLILRKSTAASTDHQLSVKDQVNRLSPQSTHKVKLSRKSAPEESSPKSKTWRGKVVKSLRKFQGSSATSSVQQSEGTTIGIPLDDCPVTMNNEYVPLLVDICTKIVEAKGLEIVGIYRIPGNNASVAALQDAVNRGFDSLNLQDTRWNDVNVISSLLKAFFRQLPEPLFTSELYPLFIEANKLENNSQRMITLKKLIHELPAYHYETLQHLMFHLKKVVANCDINKMESRNLAIVFGPNLVRTADNNMVTMVKDMSHQCKIVETIISNVDWFFSEIEKESSQLPTPMEFVERDSAEQTSNTNLLLGNIQRVEGLTHDVSTKDIVSNIINAANKKVRIKAVKKEFEERDIDKEVEMRHQKYRRGSAPSESISAKLDSKSLLTDWLKADGVDSTNSTLSSSSRTLSSQTLSEDSASYHSLDGRQYVEHSLSVTGCLPNEHSSVGKNNSANVRGRYLSNDSTSTGNEKAPPYTILSPSTQERIKRFEAETKALLQRDLHSRRTRQDSERHKHELERHRIEMEWQRAKRDLEQDDFLDELADNPSDLTSRLSDFATKMSDLNVQCLDAASGSSRVLETSDYSSSGTSPVNSQHTSKDSPIIQSIPETKKCSGESKSNVGRLPPKPLDHPKHNLNRLKKNSGSSHIRRGKSAENIVDLHEKSGVEESTTKTSALRYGGSLDSLRGNYEAKDVNVSCSEDGDLLTSIASTLNPKLKAMLTSGHQKYTCHQHPHLARSSEEQRLNYRDPSLYRNRREPLALRTHHESSKSPKASPLQKSIYRDPSMHRQNRPNNRQGIVGNEHFLRYFENEQDSTSVKKENRHKKNSGEIETDTFRCEYTTLKATISPSKNYVKMSPASTAIINLTCKESKIDSGKSKLSNAGSKENLFGKVTKRQKSSSKRAPLKRRHTVTGIQDFDKFKWLLTNENSRYSKEPRLSAWEQLRPEESIPPEQRSLKSWMLRERLRTSSPDLCHLKRMSIGGDSICISGNESDKIKQVQEIPVLESLV